MRRCLNTVDTAAFLTSLRDKTAQGVYAVAYGGGEIPVSVQLSASPELVFTFNGAIDRRKQSIPRFAATGLREFVPASIIAIADPTLACDENLPLGWYAGHQGFELQKILPELIGEIVTALAATRVVFVGGSGGGFAALYYSWTIPRSVAIVSNPQTIIENYNPLHIDLYRRCCWPSLPESATLDSVIDPDLRRLYSERFENTVIYFQIANDHDHLTRHFSPFLASLPRETAAHLILRIGAWGKQGHRPVPKNIWIPWLVAALTAPTTESADIEKMWHAMNQPKLPPLVPLEKSPPVNRDRKLATLLSRGAIDDLLEH